MIKMSNIIRKLIYILVLTPLFYFQGVFAYAEAGSKVAIFFLLMGVITPLFIYFLFKKESIRVGPVTGLLALHLFILTLVTLFSFDKHESLWGGARDMTGLLFYIFISIFLFVAVNVVRTDKHWDNIFLISVAAGTITAMVAYFQILEVSYLFGRGSLMGNSSFMGSYLIFTVFIAVYLFFKKNRIIYLLLALLMILPMCLFTSRAAFGATVMGFLLLGMLWLAFKVKKPVTRKIGKIILLISIITASFTLLLIFHPIKGGIFEGSLGRTENILRSAFFEASDGMRYIFWEQSVKGFMERPIFGWGLNSFHYIFFRHFDSEILHSQTEMGIRSGNSHNIIYEKLVTMGILGLLSYLALTVGVVFLFWKGYKQKRTDFYVPAVFTAMITAHFVQQLTVYDTYSSLLILFLVFGYAGYLSDNRHIKVSKRVVLPVLMLTVVLGGSLVYMGFYKPIRSNYYLIEALIESNPQKRISLSKKAIRLADMDRSNARLVLAENLHMYMYNYSLLYEKIEMKEEDKIEMIKFHLEELKKEEPSSRWRILMEKARYYAISGDYENSVNTLKDAQKISPQNPQTLWILAEVQVIKGDFNRARNTIKEFIDMQPQLEHSNMLAQRLLQIIEEKENH